jgi:hypothetical protein
MAGKKYLVEQRPKRVSDLWIRTHGHYGQLLSACADLLPDWNNRRLVAKLQGISDGGGRQMSSGFQPGPAWGAKFQRLQFKIKGQQSKIRFAYRLNPMLRASNY